MLDLNPTREEAASVEIPATPEYASLVERMGVEAIRMRLAREQILRLRMMPLFQHSDGLADRRLAVRLLDRAFRWTGFSGRGQKNFRTIERVFRDWRIRGFPKKMDGFTILHVSDLHLDFDSSAVERLQKAVEGLDYDIVCITGDFFDLVFEEEGIDESLLQKVVGLFHRPVYAVLGNHDILGVGLALERMGVHLLMNESRRLGPPGGGFLLAGLDDPRMYKVHSFDRALAGRIDSEPVVLLAHSPQVYKEASERRVDMVLSGHTHGGQVCLPGGIPVSRSFGCPRRIMSRDWRYGELQGYTSHGCGGCKLPYRLNASAEIALHTLRSRT